jgi:hypothetical protein
MTKEEIITCGVDSDNEKSLFISTFTEKRNAEVVAVLGAWMDNGFKYEDVVFENFVLSEMIWALPYVLNYGKDGKWKEKGSASMIGILTYSNLHNLLTKLYETYIMNEDLEHAFYKYFQNYKRHKCKYAHDALSLIFSGNTGFQTIRNNGTFYRYNLLFYWLTYKLKIWKYASIGLLPCNDKIFENAYKYGVIPKRMKSTLTNTIKLTEIAKEMFGDNDFYKLYEFLNFYKE